MMTELEQAAVNYVARSACHNAAAAPTAEPASAELTSIAVLQTRLAEKHVAQAKARMAADASEKALLKSEQRMQKAQTGAGSAAAATSPADAATGAATTSAPSAPTTDDCPEDATEALLSAYGLLDEL